MIHYNSACRPGGKEMIALHILDTKMFMKQFLVLNTFDRWNLSEGTITTFCTFTIDGTWQRDFYDPDGVNILYDRTLTPWSKLREYCFSLIRGKNTPLSFKFVFVLPEELIGEFLTANGLNNDPDEIAGLYLNISFRNKKLLLTTGTALRTFSLDRSIDASWDVYVRGFLRRYGIAAETAE